MAKQIRVAAKMTPENGKKMLELEERVNGELQAYLLHHADKSEAEMISRANMTLYNMAQSRALACGNCALRSCRSGSQRNRILTRHCKAAM